MITRKLKHVTYTIEQDPNPINPRKEYDNLTTIALTNNRYLTGDELLTNSLISCLTPSRQLEYLPIYAYIHSGIALSNSPFECPWDSGLIGYIYTTKDIIQKEFSCVQWRKTAKQVLAAEFNSYKLYVEGDCYLITITDNYTDEVLDCCGGYIDTLNNVKKHAIETAKHLNTQKAKQFNRLTIEVC